MKFIIDCVDRMILVPTKDHVISPFIMTYADGRRQLIVTRDDDGENFFGITYGSARNLAHVKILEVIREIKFKG